jgi:hypothetical protein
MVRLAVRPAESDGDRGLTRRWAPDREVEVACFTNADKVSVNCGAEPVEMIFDPELGFWRGTVTPGRSRIIAEVLVGDTTLRDELTLGSDPVALAAEVWAAPEVWRAGLDRVAGGRTDVHQIECRVVDQHGHLAQGEVMITAAVDGGELLGLDNGDLSDPTPYRADHRSTLDGMLIAYVRGAGATVTLRATGLPDLVVAVSSAPEVDLD